VRQLVAVAALAACKLERVCAQRRHGPINETLAPAYLMREAIRRHQSEEGGNQTSSETLAPAYVIEAALGPVAIWYAIGP